MHQLGIAALNPELPDLESTQFKAAVTLIWPYSSSARQFALLLAEPDFRLRRKKGQVRARFSGSSAKALATTGVGIGDEIILSLRGAQFVQEGAVSTPGKSIDWELSYSQTVAIRIFRDGNEIKSLELDDVAPTPASRSPVRPSPVPAQNWSSPAFLKRLRLSDGPFFEAPYDPLVDEDADGHDTKRRRKSYRDWKAWTYSARTPSPEKGGIGVEEDLEMAEASPSRQPQMPRTPVSPAKQGIAAGHLDHVSDGKKTHEKGIEQGNHMRDTTYHELYAGPDELPPAEVPYAFGGDTEVETEVNTEEEDTVEIEPDATSVSTTEADTADLEDEVQIPDNDAVEVESVTNKQNLLGGDTESATEADSQTERMEAQQTGDVVVEVWEDGEDSHATNLTDAPTISMPPPTLHNLQTNFPAATVPGMLTPIGREPPSPTLEPMDSATLPLPSPFPGERDTDETSSYLDHVSTQKPSAEPEDEKGGDEELPSDASYIGETSFFSSINSSRASVLHPNHESAFTPVRFTFGMDGAGFSRPLVLSSPVQQESRPNVEEELADHVEPADKSPLATSMTLENEASSPLALDLLYDTLAARQLEESLGIQPKDHPEAQKPSSIIELFSSSEAEESEAPGSEASGEGGDNDGSLAIASDLDQGELEEESAIAINKEQSAAEIFDDIENIHDTHTEDAHSTFPFTPDLATLDTDMPSQDHGDEGESLREPLSQSSEVSETRIDQHKLATSEPPVLPSQDDITAQNEATARQADTENFSELINVDYVPEPADVVTTSKEPMRIPTLPQHEENNSIVPLDEEQVLVADEPDHYSPLKNTDADMQDASSHLEYSEVEDHHPDIKMESIEDPSSFQMSEPHAETTQDSPDELLISVPGEEDKIGEMHTRTVPDTAPARNTRSRTKTTTSPALEEAPAPRRTTRSTRSKASATSVARTTLSPPAMHTRSTTPPSHEDTQASPKRLRSQQEELSPTQDTALSAPSPRRSSRKHASQRSVDSIPDVDSSQSGAHDALNSSFIPSQAAELDTQGDEPSQLKSPPAPKTRAGARSGSNNTKVQVTSPTKSSSPPGAVTVTPINIRRTRHHAYDMSGEHQGPVEELLDLNMLVSQREGESSQIQSSLAPAPSTSETQENAHHSTPSRTFAVPSVNQQSLKDSNTLLTPEATQQSTTESQPGIHLAQQQSLPMTPQLTQVTSAGLRSSQVDVDMEKHVEDATTTPITKSTPRRNVTTTDVASASASPQSARASPSPEASKSEQPSIGLSTPLAYYTPLKDLLFFLNRSSQFHSSDNPDIFALVTTATSISERATKGPKHWNTTLHITDLSAWPATTTVNIFRAYQTALPHADAGDVILLRGFAVKSLNRHPMLLSADESSWCVWRFGKPVWGHGKGEFGELVAREEVKGPSVERGEGEWREVGRLREWWLGKVKGELEEKEESQVKTRSRDKKKVDGDAGA